MKFWSKTKVGKIINDNFDARMSGAVFYYILEKGMDNIKEFTDEDIDEIPGNGLMSADFCKALVKTARDICRECSENDILVFTRCHIPLEPQISDVQFYKEDVNENMWNYICYEFDFDPDETEAIEFHGWAEDMRDNEE